MKVNFTFCDKSSDVKVKVTFCGGSHYVASALLHLDQPAEGGGGRDLQLIHNPLIDLRFAQIC